MKKLLGLVMVITPFIWVISGLSFNIDWELLLKCTIDLLPFWAIIFSMGVGIYILSD